MTPVDKQSVKQLVGQGVSNIEITDPGIKDFERISRKYGVDFAVKKDRGVTPPKYLAFFKGKETIDLYNTSVTNGWNVEKRRKGCVPEKAPSKASNVWSERIRTVVKFVTSTLSS